jgi:hypothetical protein
MAFQVGVKQMRVDTPTRCVQRLSAAVADVEGSKLAALNRGRISSPLVRDESTAFVTGGGEARRNRTAVRQAGGDR